MRGLSADTAASSAASSRDGQDALDFIDAATQTVGHLHDSAEVPGLSIGRVQEMVDAAMQAALKRLLSECSGQQGCILSHDAASALSPPSTEDEYRVAYVMVSQGLPTEMVFR